LVSNSADKVGLSVTGGLSANSGGGGRIGVGLRSIDGFFDGARFSESPRGGGGRHYQMWVVRGVGDQFWLQRKFLAR